MHNTINKFFTFDRNPVAEQRLGDALSELSAGIAASPVAEMVRCVALGGGYGRGEGGATADGNLYNDLDFFVFPAAGANYGELEACFAGLSHGQAGKLGIEVDFFIAPSSGWLVENETTLMVQELLAGHRTIYGDESVFVPVKKLDWSELPWSEGARLLLNRGTGLLLAAEKAGDMAAADFINRNIRKAELGCGDALLIASHAYCRTGMERLEALRKLGGGAQSLSVAYHRALEFKYRPGLPEAEDYAGELAMAIAVWQKTLRSFVALVGGREVPASADAAEVAAMLPACPGESAERILKNIILGILYYPRLGQLRPLTAHPRQKLLPLLVRSFRNANERERFFRLWRKWN